MAFTTTQLELVRRRQQFHQRIEARTVADVPIFLKSGHAVDKNLKPQIKKTLPEVKVIDEQEPILFIPLINRDEEQPLEAQMVLPRPKIRQIQNAVCQTFRVDLHEVISRRKTRGVLPCRHIAMMLCKMLTFESLPEIGRRFHRDHTTILHAIRKYQWLADQLRNELKQSDPVSAWVGRALELISEKK